MCRHSRAAFSFVWQVMIPGPPYLSLITTWAADMPEGMGKDGLMDTAALTGTPFDRHPGSVCNPLPPPLLLLPLSLSLVSILPHIGFICPPVNDPWPLLSEAQIAHQHEKGCQNHAMRKNHAQGVSLQLMMVNKISPSLLCFGRPCFCLFEDHQRLTLPSCSHSM